MDTTALRLTGAAGSDEIEWSVFEPTVQYGYVDEARNRTSQTDGKQIEFQGRRLCPTEADVLNGAPIFVAALEAQHFRSQSNPFYSARRKRG